MTPNLDAIRDHWMTRFRETAELITDTALVDPDIANDIACASEVGRVAFRVGLECGIQAGIAGTMTVLHRHDLIDVDRFAAIAEETP